MLPKQIAIEKKHCVTAAYQTFGLNNSLHCGLKKNKIPSNAPGRVRVFARSINITMYGKIAKKYAAFPELFTPRTRINPIKIHVTAKQAISDESGFPIPL